MSALRCKKWTEKNADLISGVIFLATGGVLMLFALLGSELILGYWLRDFS